MKTLLVNRKLGISLWDFESWELDAPCDISEVETFVVDKSGQFQICWEQLLKWEILRRSQNLWEFKTVL